MTAENPRVVPADRPAATSAATARLPFPLLLVLGALFAVPPLVTDVYLPALPDLATALRTSPSLAEATVSACAIGLALGQLVVGPYSDRAGRLRPLKAGVVLLALSSFACAVAPTIAALLVLRFAQGLAGSAILVTGRAMVRDQYGGDALSRIFSQLMLASGIAPIAGPVIGGQILRLTSWRGVFVTLGVLAVLMLAGAQAMLRETRREQPEAQRRQPVGRVLWTLATDRQVAGYTVISGMQGVMMFSYLSLGPFVLRDDYHVGVSALSAILGVNAAGLVAGSQVNGLLVRRLGAARILLGVLVIVTAATAALAVALAVHGPLIAVLVPVFFMVAPLNTVGVNTIALALTPHGAIAGTAAALLGSATFVLGSAVPPVVSLIGGTGDFGGTVLVAALVGLATLTALVRPAYRTTQGKRPRLARRSAP